MYGEAEIYKEVKRELDAFGEFKRIGLWNNQFENETEESPIPDRCVFIELKTSDFENVGAGRKVQKKKVAIILHIAYKSLLDNDVRILEMKQRIYGVIHGKRLQLETVGVLKRTDEVQNTDHDSLYIYEQTYECFVLDNEADKTYTKKIELTPIINIEVK